MILYFRLTSKQLVYSREQRIMIKNYGHVILFDPPELSIILVHSIGAHKCGCGMKEEGRTI